MLSFIDTYLKSISMQDIFLWPCGTWCYREDILEYRCMSDDFKVIKEGTEEYKEFLKENTDA